MPGEGGVHVCDRLLYFLIAVAYTVFCFQTKSPNSLLLVLCIFSYDRYCADHYANGNCDPSCNKEACGWDGLDCSAETPQVVDGTLILVVRLQPKELLGDMRGFLRALGALLRTNLRVKLDKNNEPMIFPWVEEEHGRQRTRSKRELEREVIG